MQKTKFINCAHCSNLAEMIYDTDIPLKCCGDEMKQLVPGSVKASGEKHTPVVKVAGNIVEVNVGDIHHPMEEDHWIEWVQLVTDQGSYRKWLRPGQKPSVQFLLVEEKALEVYAYCNLHGLWKTELNEK